jgi:hypothetical protein
VKKLSSEQKNQASNRYCNKRKRPTAVISPTANGNSSNGSISTSIPMPSMPSSTISRISCTSYPCYLSNFHQDPYNATISVGFVIGSPIIPALSNDSTSCRIIREGELGIILPSMCSVSRNNYYVTRLDCVVIGCAIFSHEHSNFVANVPYATYYTNIRSIPGELYINDVIFYITICSATSI